MLSHAIHDVQWSTFPCKRIKESLCFKLSGQDKDTGTHSMACWLEARSLPHCNAAAFATYAALNAASKEFPRFQIEALTLAHASKRGSADSFLWLKCAQ
eukprot:scaffold23127_cov16-Tisochrysis_lutea.AAC.1